MYLVVHLIASPLGRVLYDGWRIYSDEPAPRYLGWVDGLTLTQLEARLGPVRSLGPIYVTRAEICDSRRLLFNEETAPCAT